MKQIDINLYKGTHGGRRPNSGRKRLHSPGVSHSERQKITRHTPLHINFKYKVFIRNLSMIEILERACLNASKYEFRVTHYTIQTNHIHLIAEAENNEVLIKGMRSLTNTIVKLVGKGSIQTERYHLHVLKTPNEVRNAVQYVLNNDIKHAGKSNKMFTHALVPARSWLLSPPNLRPKYK